MTARRAASPPPPLPEVLPVLPLREIVLPFITAPLTAISAAQQAAAEAALAEDRILLLLAPRPDAGPDPGPRELHRVGTAVSIQRLLRLPDGRIRLLVQGLTRVRVRRWAAAERPRRARVEIVPEPAWRRPGARGRALMGLVRDGLDRLAALGLPMSPDLLTVAHGIDQPGRLADLAASNLDLDPARARDLLEQVDPWLRLERAAALLDEELRSRGLQQELAESARGEAERGHRDFLLRQQLKAIQRELGEAEEVGEEAATYRRLAEERGLSEEARAEVERQVRRLERGQADSAEATLVRTYLDWLTGLPWSVTTPDRLDLAAAARVLDDDHCGLEHVKERLLEFLAVRQLAPAARGPILCFVGPPGVGKTSLGRSVARALGRRFVRLSLGGVHDEAEIRGHRRTYVGALPGRLLQGLHQAASSNPVFMLDEIDKVGADARGDPAAALLEALDAEQNATFRDHYLGVPYDLSRVLFIATANVLDPIHPAFVDRMEVLRLPGYAAEEKLEIARRHLVPRALAAHGLARERLRIDDRALVALVADYTREAGVRELERRIAALCRKVARAVVEGRTAPRRIRAADLDGLLGAPTCRQGPLPDRDRAGVATGLAWTAAGGEVLLVEALATPGEGRLQLTGQLGEVMRESGRAALTLVRASTAGDPAATAFFAAHDLHLHVPAGAIPKDGPSAGVTLGVALLSLATNRPARRTVALTGELTLRGDLLPVGGVREKLLAARAAGVGVVVLPGANRREAEEVPEALRRGLALRFADRFAEAAELALAPPEADG